MLWISLFLLYLVFLLTFVTLLVPTRTEVTGKVPESFPETSCWLCQTPFSWVLGSRGLDMCLSLLCRLWEKFRLLFFLWTRPAVQSSTLLTPGSKEKVLKQMGESKRVIKENVRCQSRTLLQMPQTAMHNVTSFMESFLHFGKFRIEKTPTSQPSSMRLPHYVDSKEGEVLRNLYVVLWTTRERIRELVRRQERRRHRHSRPLFYTPSAQGSKQDARSPL